MSLIMPIKDLRNTTEISNLAHKIQEPIDLAIHEAEQEVANGAKAMDADEVFAELEKKYLDK